MLRRRVDSALRFVDALLRENAFGIGDFTPTRLLLFVGDDLQVVSTRRNPRPE